MILAGVAADEAIEVLEAHAVRSLVEGPGLGRLIEGRVVILAEPRGRVPVLLQDGADSERHWEWGVYLIKTIKMPGESFAEVKSTIHQQEAMF